MEAFAELYYGLWLLQTAFFLLIIIFKSQKYYNWYNEDGFYVNEFMKPVTSTTSLFEITVAIGGAVGLLFLLIFILYVALISFSVKLKKLFQAIGLTAACLMVISELVSVINFFFFFKKLKSSDSFSMI